MISPAIVLLRGRAYTRCSYLTGEVTFWGIEGNLFRAIKPFKRARIAVIAGVAAAMIMVGSPAAQAYWNYRYKDGYSFQNQKWSSISGTDSGGRVNVGQPGAYFLNPTEYSATFDGATGYWLNSMYAAAGGWAGYYHSPNYGAFEQCWWNANADMPNAQPQTLCEQFKD